MADEDALIKATKNKGRSASVCFSSRSDRGLDSVNVSPPRTPPATSGVKYARRPASRSQSARLTGGKSVRRRVPASDVDIPDSPHSIKAGISDPKIHDVSGTLARLEFFFLICINFYEIYFFQNFIEEINFF